MVGRPFVMLQPGRGVGAHQRPVMHLGGRDGVQPAADEQHGPVGERRRQRRQAPPLPRRLHLADQLLAAGPAQREQLALEGRHVRAPPGGVEPAGDRTEVEAGNRDGGGDARIAGGGHQGREAAEAVPDDRQPSGVEPVGGRERLLPHRAHHAAGVLKRVRPRPMAADAPGAAVVEDQGGVSGPAQRLREVEVALVAREAVQQNGHGVRALPFRQVQNAEQRDLVAVERHRGCGGSHVDLPSVKRER